MNGARATCAVSERCPSAKKGSDGEPRRHLAQVFFDCLGGSTILWRTVNLSLHLPSTKRFFTAKGMKNMAESLPVVYVARHGETAWSLSGQHTGLTDLPLTPRGEKMALALGERLKGLTFLKILTSPL